MVFEDRMLEKLLKLLKAINLQTKGGHQTLSIKQDTHTHTHTHTHSAHFGISCKQC